VDGFFMRRTVEGLHVVIDTHIDNNIRDEIIAAQPAVIQLREKGDLTENQERIADFGSDLRKLLHGSDILFALNDHVALGVHIGADIVHTGQNDMPVEEVGKYLKSGMEFGISVQNAEQGLLAQKHGASYVGLPVWSSEYTKSDTRPEGLEAVSTISDYLSIPIIGIGGIKQSNAHLVMQHHARGLAVAGEVTRSSDPKESVLELQGIIYQYNNNPKKLSA
jgi:thiamine-phosphate pyrophosphorylase